MAQRDMHLPDDNSTLLAQLAGEEYCYLITTGRISGRPHEIEIWFGLLWNSLYLLSGGMDRSDWVRNILKNSSVSVRIGRYTFAGTARIVTDEGEEMMARTMLAEKYQEWETGKQLSAWARTALPVAIDLTVEGS